MNYKISKYNHWKGKKLFNDYTDNLIHTTKEMRIVYDLVAKGDSIPSELQSVFDRLREKKIFINSNVDELMSFNILKIDIDVNTHCNASCQYCPQSTHPRPYDVMPLDLFKQIADKIAELNISWLALHIYGEPLLDPLYKQRVEYLKEKGIPLYFFSNATMLTDELIDFLKDKLLHGAMFNFPSIDREQWKELTQLGDKQFDRAKVGIENFIKMYSGKLSRLEIVVNGNSLNHKERTESVYNYYSQFGDVIVNGWESNSRAGSIENEYVNNVSHSDNTPFSGCSRVVNQLHINIEGDVILCCQDYFQNVKLGNILEQSIDEIMNSAKLIDIRRQVYGDIPMKSDMLCRSCSMIRIK